MPAYNDTPLATNPINQTQALIRTNFTSLRQSFDVNHFDFTDANFGKHKFVDMPQQGAAPAGAANQITLYGFNGTSGQTELYVNANGASNFSITGRGAFWSMLPSGLILKWGSLDPVAANTLATKVVPSGSAVAGPVMSSIITVQLTPETTAGSPQPQNLSLVTISAANSFTYISTTTVQGGRYLVIGTL